MKNSSKIISNETEPGKYIVSANKVMIEIHIVERRYYNVPKWIIEKTITRVHNETETMSKLTVIY